MAMASIGFGLMTWILDILDWLYQRNLWELRKSYIDANGRPRARILSIDALLQNLGTQAREIKLTPWMV